MPVPEAVKQFPRCAKPLAGTSARLEERGDPGCGPAALPGGPESNEPAQFDPCLETLKVINRLMAEFFNVEKFEAGEKVKTRVEAGRSGTGKRPVSMCPKAD